MYKIFLCTKDNILAKNIAKIAGDERICRIRNLEELSGNGVVIVGKAGENCGRVPAGFVGVAPEDDAAALLLLRESGTPVVTCGFSPTASLTLSAIGEQSAAICLQRQVHTLSGNIAEEGDIRIEIGKGWDKTALMLCVAAMLLVGENCSPNLLFDITEPK